MGGGIAGLASALCLRARGSDVCVLEAAPEIGEVGAGLQISPNGAAVLEALGLQAELDAVSTQLNAVHLADGLSGRCVLKLDLTKGAARYGRPFRAVHRADLIGLLETAARRRDVTIETGVRAEVAMPDSQTLRLADGRTRSAPVILGADGVKSSLRPHIASPSTARFTRQVAWRATIPLPAEWPAEARVDMLPGAHVVTYPLTARSLLNIVAVEETPTWTEDGWAQSGDPSELQSRFAQFNGPAAPMLRQITHCGRWGLFTHPVPKTWSKGAIGLLGDAVHPTLPFLAQGANMALEDAWILAKTLSAAPAPAKGLSHFTTARRARVRKIVKAASKNAQAYHLRPPIRGAAHIALGLMSHLAPDAPLRRFDWLYGHDVTGPAPL